MKVICLGNYPPRQCGIATFTENLVNAILNAAGTQSSNLSMEIIAMNDCSKTYSYPAIVSQSINSMVMDEYIRMAGYINNSGAQLCLVQHEYGIFGGESGLLLLSLLRRLKIPVVTTLHTVLQKPSFHQLEVLKKIAAYSTKLVVMNKLAINILENVYDVPATKIVRIEHGVPDQDLFKNQLTPPPAIWKSRKVMLTFGLLSRNKGIETALRALPQIVDKHPDFLYVILGKTHPHVKYHTGEEYREYLIQLAKNLGVESNVHFIDEYVSEIKLVSYLNAADLYVTPYLNKAQITSGTLSYAVSGGCAVISTPYWHAEEILAKGRGLFFDFGNHTQLAEIVNNLLDNPGMLAKLQQKASEHGKTITWPKVGKAYLILFEAIIRQSGLTGEDNTKVSVCYPEFDITQLKNLTDHTGLLQHAKGSVPFYKAGYCTDDNARAILVCMMAWNRSKNNVYLDLLQQYLAFLINMQNKDGSFTNYMNYDHTLVEDSSDDSLGRAIWAMGYLVRFAPNNSLFFVGLELFEHSLSQINNLSYARGYANSIFGLYHYIKKFPDQEKFLKLLTLLADQLCSQLAQHKHENWCWFEDTMTYDNGLLPSALYRAYEITGSTKYFEAAEESRIFLESKCFREDWLSLIGNLRWLHFDQDYEMFAQQPVDAMAMIVLYQSAWEATGNAVHLEKLRLSYDWFFGINDLNISLIDLETKGCHDGIEEFSINRNQGAESNIAYLMSWLIAEPFLHSAKNSVSRFFRYEEASVLDRSVL